MKKTVRIRPRASLDLVEQCEYFILKENIALADRYRAAFERTCARLCRNPARGVPYWNGGRELTGIRWAGVTGFKNYLIFYLSLPDGIDVIRVLHGARNISAVLEEQV